jgi:hypothetical protein
VTVPDGSCTTPRPSSPAAIRKSTRQSGRTPALPHAAAAMIRSCAGGGVLGAHGGRPGLGICEVYEREYDVGMTQRKRRLTVTVDPELVEAGNRAVANGAADSLSAWVSAALAERARRDEHLARLQEAVADFESEFGEITAEEIARQQRADGADAVVVRGRRSQQRASRAKSA